MSKELEALEFIKNDLIAFWLNGPHLECPNGKDFVEGHYRLDIIENALKDYERRLALAKEYKDVNNVAKRLKALEIIKEKDVDIVALKISINLKQYNCKEDGRCPLTQEEYDLLKEVLV